MRLIMIVSLAFAALLPPCVGAADFSEEQPAASAPAKTRPADQAGSKSLRQSAGQERSATVEMKALVPAEKTKRARNTFAPATGNPGKGVAIRKVGPAKAQAKPTTPTAELRPITREDLGVEVQSIRLTANGFMLDFRYKVLDAKKAAPLFRRRDKPYVIDQATGGTFAVPNMPKVGQLRNSDPPQENRTYFVMFGNPRQFIKKGNKVTVVIGNYKAENLVVQ